MPQYSLRRNTPYQVAGFTPATFQGSVAEFAIPDYNKLATAFGVIENRVNKLAEQRGAIAAAINKLPMNSAEDAWKANYINNISAELDKYAQEGDYAGAVQKATELANSAVYSPEVLGRLRAQQQYQEEVERNRDRLRNHEISQNTFNWWLKKNPYKYEDTYDENGKIVGGSEFKSTPLYADLQLPNLAKMAFDLATPKKTDTSVSGSSTVQNNSSGALSRNGKTYKSGEQIGGHRDIREQTQKVDIETIRQNMSELVQQLPDGWNQVEQAYWVAKYSYEQLEKDYEKAYKADPNGEEAKQFERQLQVRNSEFYHNGAPINYDEWFARQITNNLIAQNLAYEWNVSKVDTGSVYSYTPQTTQSNGDGGYAYYDHPVPGATWDASIGKWKTPTVIMQDDTANSQKEVSSSTENIRNRIKE